MTPVMDQTVAEKLSLQDSDVAIVVGVLRDLIPGRDVWAFGSRARGVGVKRFSDLDLAVSGRLSWTERANLTEAFDECLLPIKVEVVELDMIDAEFRERIAKDLWWCKGA